jgi:hypothetical protein
MSEHRDWQQKVALRHFRAADTNLPRQVRLAAASAYSGASIADVNAWLKGAGL